MPNITGNNSTINSEDVLIVSFNGAFTDVQSIDTFSDTFSGATAFISYTKEFRWSNSGISFSSWNIIVSDGSTSFSGIPSTEGDDVWLEFRYTRGGTGTGTSTIDSINVEYSQVNTETVAALPPAKSCGQANFCAGITINCDKNLFNPYDVNPAICLYDKMNSAVSEMFGHCVKYFKVDPDNRTRDVILKEYTLFNVVDVKELKVVVPNNEFPDNRVQYNPYDMDFEDGFEIQITKQSFELAFGQNEQPQEKDYLYFPILDRIYEINSAYLYKDFMQHGTYYRLNLVKWQDKKNVIRGATAQSELDEIGVVTLDEFFGEEEQEEFVKITHPKQYNTIGTSQHDFIRSEINADLKIIDEDLNNYWTVVAKYYYKLSTLNHLDLAVKYKTEVSIGATENRAYTMWFNVQRKSTDGATAYDPLLYGHDGTDGIKLDLNYISGATTAAGATSIGVTIGSTAYTFNDSFPTLDSTKWYSLVVNLSNTYNEVSVYLWEMTYDADQFRINPQAAQTTNLTLIFSESQSINIGSINPTDQYYELYAGGLGLTNLRVFNETIEEEKQPLIVNQYVVKDNHKIIMLDNSLPQIRLSRTNVR